MTCKQCKYYMECALFADAIEESGVELTDGVAASICRTVRREK